MDCTLPESHLRILVKNIGSWIFPQSNGTGISGCQAQKPAGLSPETPILRAFPRLCCLSELSWIYHYPPYSPFKFYSKATSRRNLA